MLNEHTLDQLRALRLDGMVHALEDQASSTAAAELPFDARLTLLVQREIAWRDDRRVARLLKAAKLEDGSPLRVVELPMPRPVVFDGLRIPASYANFLIINGCVLVPTFNDPADRHALNILADCFPDRAIIGISAIDLIWGFGTLHCLSQQIPMV